MLGSSGARHLTGKMKNKMECNALYAWESICSTQILKVQSQSQSQSSGLPLSEKPDLKMSSLRKSVGFGTVAVVYFVLLHYIPAPLCQSSSSNSGEDRKVCMGGNCLGFVGKSTTFLMKRLIKVLLCHY